SVFLIAVCFITGLLSFFLSSAWSAAGLDVAAGIDSSFAATVFEDALMSAIFCVVLSVLGPVSCAGILLAFGTSFVAVTSFKAAVVSPLSWNNQNPTLKIIMSAAAGITNCEAWPNDK